MKASAISVRLGLTWQGVDRAWWPSRHRTGHRRRLSGARASAGRENATGRI